MVPPEIERMLLQEQLSAVDKKIRQAMAERSSRGWGIGPIRANAPSGLIFLLFIGFHLSCLAAGITLIISAGVLRTIGIAVTVGAIFAFGTFMAQWWLVVAQRELQVRDAAFSDSDAALWRDLSAQRRLIAKRLEQLPIRLADGVPLAKDIWPDLLDCIPTWPRAVYRLNRKAATRNMSSLRTAEILLALRDNPEYGALIETMLKDIAEKYANSGATESSEARDS